MAEALIDLEAKRRRRSRLAALAAGDQSGTTAGADELTVALRGSLTAAERTASVAAALRDQMREDFDFIGAAKAQRVVAAARRAAKDAEAAISAHTVPVSRGVTMPGTHRTPPDASVPPIVFRTDGDTLWHRPRDFRDALCDHYNGTGTYAFVAPGDVPVTEVCPDCLTAALVEQAPAPESSHYPDHVAALAAHLTVDARRALTRDLAAQDGDAVVGTVDLDCALRFDHGIPDTLARLRAAVEAARPTPTPEETR